MDAREYFSARLKNEQDIEKMLEGYKEGKFSKEQTVANLENVVVDIVKEMDAFYGCEVFETF